MPKITMKGCEKLASSANYSILLDAEFQSTQIKKSLKEATDGIKVKVGVDGDEKLGKTTDAVKDLKDAGEEVEATWNAANIVFSKTIEIFSAMADQVFELDGAITEFRKVSDLQGKSLDNYVDKLGEMGKITARTTSEMVEASTEFRKSGFSDNDAANLALVATELQNVADEELSAGDASNFIVSQLRAFNLEAGDAAHILDALNEVSNSYAVSSSDLTRSLPIVASALAVGNNKFEEMIGLVTGAVEVTRNASKASRGLISVQSRLNQIVDESSSTGQKLLEFYNQHNISVYDQDGQLRSLYDILTDVSKQWGSLTTNEKDYYLNIQAGANQTTQLSAILSNFDNVLAATETAYNSAGSAAKENTAYMESLEAQSNLLKAEFQDLANNVISKQFVGGGLKVLNFALQALNTDLGTSIIQVGGLAGAISAIPVLLKPILGVLKAFPMALGKVGIVATGGQIALVVAGLVGLFTIGKKIYEQWKEANPTFEETKQKLSDLGDKLKSNQDRLKEINEIPWSERTPEIEKERKELEEENERLREQIELWKEKKVQSAQKVAGQKQDVYTGNVTGYEVYSKGVETGETLSATVSTLEEANTYAKALGDGFSRIAETEEIVTTQGDELNKILIDGLKKTTQEINAQNEVTQENQQWWINNKAVVKEQVDAYKDLQDAGVELSEEQKELIALYDDYIDRTKFLNENIIASQTAIDNLKKKYPELSAVIDENNGQLGINYVRLGQMQFASDEAKQELIKLIAQETIFNNSTLDTTQKVGELIKLAGAAGVAAENLVLLEEAKKGDTRAGQAIVARGGSLQSYFNNLISQFSVSVPKTAPTTAPSASAGSGGGSSKAKTAKETTTKETDAIKEQTNALKEQKKALEDVVKLYSTRISAYKTIFAFYTGELDDQIDEVQKRIDNINESYDERIDSLNKQNDALEEELRLEEALEDLAKAKAQRTMVYSGGKFQYIADPDAVSDAQSNLNQINRERQMAEQIAAIEAERERALGAPTAQLEQLQNQKETINKLAENVEQTKELNEALEALGIEYTGNFEDIKGLMGNYESDLENLESIETVVDQLDSIIESLEATSVEKGGSGKMYGTTHTGEKYTIGSEKGQDFIKSAAAGSVMKGGDGSTWVKNADGSTTIASGNKVYNVPKYANGSLGTSGGLSLVGERGAELRVMNRGDGILPAEVTKNLWDWGRTSPAEFFGANGKGNMSVSIQNLNLPEVHNGEDFVNYLRNNLFGQMLSFAH